MWRKHDPRVEPGQHRSTVIRETAEESLLSKKDHHILRSSLSHPIKEEKRLLIDPSVLDTDSVDMKGVAH